MLLQLIDAIPNMVDVLLAAGRSYERNPALDRACTDNVNAVGLLVDCTRAELFAILRRHDDDDTFHCWSMSPASSAQWARLTAPWDAGEWTVIAQHGQAFLEEYCSSNLAPLFGGELLYSDQWLRYSERLWQAIDAHDGRHVERVLEDLLCCIPVFRRCDGASIFTSLTQTSNMVGLLHMLGGVTSALPFQLTKVHGRLLELHIGIKDVPGHQIDRLWRKGRLSFERPIFTIFINETGLLFHREPEVSLR